VHFTTSNPRIPFAAQSSIVFSALSPSTASRRSSTGFSTSWLRAVRKAFAHLVAGRHLGKIVIRIQH
jgi:hypothetical protein